MKGVFTARRSMGLPGIVLTLRVVRDGFAYGTSDFISAYQMRDFPLRHLLWERFKYLVTGMANTIPPERREMYCPECGYRHVDEGKWAYLRHKKHLCGSCSATWRPAEYATVGV